MTICEAVAVATGAFAARFSRGVLELARTVKPDAVTLDLRLPDIDGWVLLDRLKHDPSTRHIPVHVISGLDEERRSLQNGALGFLQKPVTVESLQTGLEAVPGGLAFLDLARHARRSLRRAHLG